MYRIPRSEKDPYFNLATEEHLLKTASQDLFSVYVNDPCIVIGKHQNYSREINHRFVNQRKIPVIRRITGGGTVYHDQGNLNFSFLFTGRKNNPIDFRQFTLPVILFLQSQGIPALFEGKSNIMAGGFKISGNAAHVYKGRVLYHGTLLFDSRLDWLESAILPDNDHYADRSVRSEKRQVVNIRQLMTEAVSMEKFTGSFTDSIMNYYAISDTKELSGADHEAILKLADQKYRQDSWNIGYSPAYRFINEFEIDGEKWRLVLATNNSLIESAELSGPIKYSGLIRKIENVIVGSPHEKKTIEKQLGKINFASENDQNVVNQLIDYLF